MRSDSASGDAPITQWMRSEGDALLRTCYLLCGDLSVARQATRQAFVNTAPKLNASSVFDDHALLLALLREAFRLCPCRSMHSVPFSRRDVAFQFRQLPPNLRRVALLCLYHGLNTEEAAYVLRCEETRVHRDLSRAKELLRI